MLSLEWAGRFATGLVSDGVNPGHPAWMAVFFFMMLEEMGLPAPFVSSAFVLTLGYSGGLNLRHAASTVASVLVLVVASSLAGASTIYWASRLGARPLLDRLSRRLAVTGQVERVESWLQRDGSTAILAARLTPGLLTASSIVAGTFRAPYGKFCLYVAISAALWTAFLLAVGISAGAGVAAFLPPSSEGAGMFTPLLFGLGALLVFGMGAQRLPSLMARLHRGLRQRA